MGTAYSEVSIYVVRFTRQDPSPVRPVRATQASSSQPKQPGHQRSVQSCHEKKSKDRCYTLLLAAAAARQIHARGYVCLTLTDISSRFLLSILKFLGLSTLVLNRRGLLQKSTRAQVNASPPLFFFFDKYAA